MPLRLYNTLTKRVEDFTPRDPARITFYSCGPTVYDDAHIGNFRSFLAADLLRRWIESPRCTLANSPAGSPRSVIHVMNITDVGHMTDDDNADGSGEDKMAVAGRRLAEAKKSGALPPGVDIDPTNPFQIARFYEARFREDARRLGLKLAIDAQNDPTLMPRATESIEGMIATIQRLVARGHAYVAGAPGSRVVYFRVRSFPTYGRLSGNTLDQLKEGHGGRITAENQSTKEHPADFLLWKEDTTHLMKWDSPWGKGYPGWHIECSAMSATRLAPDPNLAALTLPDGDPIIDLHSGGEDNIFPHHECEIAQSCGAFNQDPARGHYARLWFHPRFLMVEGAKMSKRAGNFYTPRDLIAPPPTGKGIEPAALRLELIKTHYRSNANFTLQGLADSQRIIDRWRRVLDSALPGTAPLSPAAVQARDQFAAALDDDLNIAGAIAAINTWINTAPAPADAALFREFDAVLGVLALERPKAAQTDIGLFAPGVDPDPRVIERLLARRDARVNKDFATSDRIRDELLAMGYAIKDVAGGKVEVRRA